MPALTQQEPIFWLMADTVRLKVKEADIGNVRPTQILFLLLLCKYRYSGRSC